MRSIKKGKGAEKWVTPAVIEARDLTTVYGRGENRVEALARVSLTVEAGEGVSLVGPSGSAKSTLMNVLGLPDKPRPRAPTPSAAGVSPGSGARSSRGRGATSWGSSSKATTCSPARRRSPTSAASNGAAGRRRPSTGSVSPAGRSTSRRSCPEARCREPLDVAARARSAQRGPPDSETVRDDHRRGGEVRNNSSEVRRRTSFCVARPDIANNHPRERSLVVGSPNRVFGVSARRAVRR